MNSLRPEIIATFAMLALLAFIGCNPQPPAPTRTGDGLVRIQTDIQSAKATGQQTVPHADATGKALLVNQKADLDDAETMTGRTIAEYERYAKKTSDDLKFQTARADKAEATYGYRAEVWIKRLAWIIGAMVAFHFVGGFIGGIFAATPWGQMLCELAKLCNPLGLFTAIIAKAQSKAAVNAVVTAAVAPSMVLPRLG